MFHKHPHSERVHLINTLLQRGVRVWRRGSNRFSGFRQGIKTIEIETVLRFRPAQNTPLKQGVNETMRSNNHLVCEMFRLTPLRGSEKPLRCVQARRIIQAELAVGQHIGLREPGPIRRPDGQIKRGEHVDVGYAIRVDR
jgi:hypothetical protein